MCRRLLLMFAFLICGILFIGGALNRTGFAQSNQNEQSRIKNFGSSLKRLKWDTQKNAAIETISSKRIGKDVEDDVVRFETSLVVSDVLVLNPEGQPVSGLRRSDFVAIEEGKPQQIDVFAVEASREVPRSFVFIIDYSLTQAGFVETSIKAASSLVESLRPKDRMAIVTDRVELLCDFTEDKQRLKTSLESLLAKAGQTSISRGSPIEPRLRRPGSHYSALFATLREAFQQDDRLPVIIFQANGNEASVLRNPIVAPPVPPDYLSGDEKKIALERYRKELRAQTSQLREFSLDDVYQAASKSRATIYTVIPGLRLLGLSPTEQMERGKEWTKKFRSSVESALLKQSLGGRHQLVDIQEWMWDHILESSIKEQAALVNLARISGGWADFIEEPSQATDVYSRILSFMQQRYVIGYYSINKERDGKLRKIDVKIQGHPEYVVLMRKSYYAASALPYLQGKGSSP